MDSVKPKTIQPEKKDKPLNILETYQRRWDQLMEDTTKQIEKIRREFSPKLSYAGIEVTDSDVQRKNKLESLIRLRRNDASLTGHCLLDKSQRIGVWCFFSVSFVHTAFLGMDSDYGYGHSLGVTGWSCCDLVGLERCQWHLGTATETLVFVRF